MLTLRLQRPGPAEKAKRNRPIKEQPFIAVSPSLDSGLRQNDADGVNLRSR